MVSEVLASAAWSSPSSCSDRTAHLSPHKPFDYTATWSLPCIAWFSSMDEANTQEQDIPIHGITAICLSLYCLSMGTTCRECCWPWQYAGVLANSVPGGQPVDCGRHISEILICFLELGFCCHVCAQLLHTASCTAFCCLCVGIIS